MKIVIHVQIEIDETGTIRLGQASWTPTQRPPRGGPLQVEEITAIAQAVVRRTVRSEPEQFPDGGEPLPTPPEPLQLDVQPPARGNAARAKETRGRADGCAATNRRQSRCGQPKAVARLAEGFGDRGDHPDGPGRAVGESVRRGRLHALAILPDQGEDPVDGLEDLGRGDHLGPFRPALFVLCGLLGSRPGRIRPDPAGVQDSCCHSRRNASARADRRCQPVRLTGQGPIVPGHHSVIHRDVDGVDAGLRRHDAGDVHAGPVHGELRSARRGSVDRRGAAEREVNEVTRAAVDNHARECNRTRTRLSRQLERKATYERRPSR